MTSTFKKQALQQQLEQCVDVREFLATSSVLIIDAVEKITEEELHSDLFPSTLSYVGAILENQTGPLGDIAVKLKLLANLGKIDEHYAEDIEVILSLKNKLYQGAKPVEFDCPLLFEAVRHLYTAKELNLMAFDLIEFEAGLTDRFYQETVHTQKKAIRHNFAKIIVALLAKITPDSTP